MMMNKGESPLWNVAGLRISGGGRGKWNLNCPAGWAAGVLVVFAKHRQPIPSGDATELLGAAPDRAGRCMSIRRPLSPAGNAIPDRKIRCSMQVSLVVDGPVTFGRGYDQLPGERAVGNKEYSYVFRVRIIEEELESYQFRWEI